MEIRPILSALSRNKTGAILIALQVALTLAILSNAMYIVRDRLSLAARPSGIDDESRLFHIAPAGPAKGADDMALQRRDEALIAAVPGVSSIAWSIQSPFAQSGWMMGLGTDRKQTDSIVNAAAYSTPGPLVKTMGLKLIAGRDFNASDVDTVDPETSNEQGHSAIVTETLAQKLYPGATSVIGKPLLIGNGSEAKELRIVGVVERLQTPWAQPGEQAEYSFLVALRMKHVTGEYIVRTEPGQRDRVMRDVEAALGKTEAGRIILHNKSIAQDRGDRYRDDRAVAWMLITVTVLLLLVTAGGIVGLASLWVTQRRKQIGVRRALGARRADILYYFITENVLITTGGIVIGVALALGMNQLLVSKLELPRLPLAYLGIGMLVLWVLGILAVYGPAWRAASVPPAVATRSV